MGRLTYDHLGMGEGRFESFWGRSLVHSECLGLYHFWGLLVRSYSCQILRAWGLESGLESV